MQNKLPPNTNHLGRHNKTIIKLWPNAVLALSHPLGQYTVCSGFSWTLINVDNKYLKKSKNSEQKNIICGIHYFITKLKKKIDVIILSRLK